MTMDRKVQIGYVLGAVALATLVGASFNIGSAFWLNILILLFGGLLGWITGFSQHLSTPARSRSFRHTPQPSLLS